MPLPSGWQGRLAVPVVASPMFLVSTPDTVVESCLGGVVGTFPALNQRTTEGYADWLGQIRRRLQEARCDTPFGVNLVVHRSNARLDADLAATVAAQVPLVITSLGLNRDLIAAVQSYGGKVFHDVTTLTFAQKARDAGVDGLIAVAHGAGGHAGTLNPFGFLTDLRQLFAGTLLLGGAISTGAQVAAAQLMGADLAYMGTRFLVTRESTAPEGHKQMVLDGNSEDIVLTPAVSGLPANFLRPSLIAAGRDPDHKAELNFGTGPASELKPWRDIWAAGQGIGAIRDLPGTRDLCHQVLAEYRAATGLLTHAAP